MGGLCPGDFFGHIVTASDGEVFDIEFDNGQKIALSDNYGLLVMQNGAPKVVRPSELTNEQYAIDIFGTWRKVLTIQQRKGRVVKVDGMDSLNINTFIVDGYKDASRLPETPRETQKLPVQEQGEEVN